VKVTEILRACDTDHLTLLDVRLRGSPKLSQPVVKCCVVTSTASVWARAYAERHITAINKRTLCIFLLALRVGLESYHVFGSLELCLRDRQREGVVAAGCENNFDLARVASRTAAMSAGKIWNCRFSRVPSMSMVSRPMEPTGTLGANPSEPHSCKGSGGSASGSSRHCNCGCVGSVSWPGRLEIERAGVECVASATGQTTSR